MRVGSRAEFLKQLTFIERAWEDVVQGLSNMIVSGGIWNSPIPLGSYLEKIRIRLVLFISLIQKTTLLRSTRILPRVLDC